MSPTLEVTTTLGGPDQQDEESDDGSISETGSVSDSESEEGQQQQVQNPHETLDFDEGSVHEEDDNEGKSGVVPPPVVGEEMDGDDDDGDKSEDGEVSDEEGAIRDESDKQESDGDEGELVDEVVEVVKRKVVVAPGGERSKVVAPPRDDDEDSVEEGEVTDEEVISELDRKDNKPVCRFFSKGQCTWGNNCRFLHPGVTDKGLYSMFETVPPPPPPQVQAMQKVPLLGNPGGGDGMSRPVVMMHAGPPVPESAWERGLRHAKEIIKASAKRKETDVDFEEKKINLSLAGDEEIDKENTDYYVRKPEHETVAKGLLDDPDYGLEDAHDFRRDKIDPEFVRERMHRIKSTSRVSAGGGGGGAGMEGSPPPRRMVRESELRKIEIEMMRGEEGRNAPEFKRSTDAYGRAPRIPPHPYPNFPRNARARISPPLPDSFKRKRSSSRSSSSSSSSSSSKSSAGRRRRQRYYSRDSEDSRSRKRKRTDSSAESSGSRRRRTTRSSGTSTSRSRSKSGNEEDKRRGNRRRRTTTASSDRSRSSSSRSSSSRSPDRDRIQGGRMFVRKAPPREGERGAREAPKPVRMAPPLAHFEKPAQEGPPPDHHHGPPPSRWHRNDLPSTGQYRRAPPPQARPQRYFQNQNRGDDRPVGLVRERDLHNAPQFHSGGGVKQATTPTPSSPKTPMASPSGSPRRKTRYKREYSSDHEHGSGLSRSRSRSRSYSRSRSRSKSETSERPPYRKQQRNNNNPAVERRKSRTSSRSSSFSTSRSRSRSPVIADTERVRKAPPAPTSPPAQPPPRSPPPRTRSSSSSSSTASITHEATTTTSKRGGNNAGSAKPKQNQIKLTLKNTSVRVINKHVIERLGGADDEENGGGAGAPLRDDEDSNGVNAPLPPPESPPPGDDLSTPGSPKPGGGNRREELLKQLKAVEEAIAKKRSKLDSTK